ncbi:MAG TPA: hypothetical protein VFT64_07855 [Rickettsiales bacterium]|nr:hypothetical protein [Rickettsiales bacterium]
MLKLIAPFRVLFSLDSSLVAANHGAFTAFLRQVEKELQDPQSGICSRISPALDVIVNVPVEASDSEIGSRYISVNANGSLYLSPRVFTVHFKASEAEELKKIYTKSALMADEVVGQHSNCFTPDIASLRVDLQDNTIATLSLELAVDTKQTGAWNRLDEWTTVLVHFLLAGLYETYIFPLLEALREFSEKVESHFIQSVNDYNIFLDLVGDADEPRNDIRKRFILMWVNRTLCYYNDYPVNAWMKPLFKQHEIQHVRGAEVHLNSGNSLVLMPAGMDTRHLGQLWDVMLTAQYYYAALDVVNLNLVKYIGTTFNRQSSRNLRRLSGEMESIINKITILQVRYNDFMMELQGVPRKLFHVLQKEWDFAVLAGNVSKKLELCKSNIEVLNQETNHRNQGRTEVVLTSLTGMGVLNLFVELGNYATQMPPEHMGMVGKIPGFMDLGFIMSGNALSWIGIFIAVSVIVYTAKNRLL